MPADIASIPNIDPGFTRLVKADNLARELGIRSLWVKDDSGNPTHSFKDRVVAVALARRPRARLHRARLPVHGQPRQRGRGRRRPRRHPGVVLIPDDLEHGQDHRQRRLRRLARRGARQLRRRQQARQRDRRRGGRLGVRERQRPAVLRRGLEDARLRGGRAARLAPARADRHPGRVRLAAHQGGQVVRRARQRSASSRRRPYKIFGAQATGCSPVSAAFKDGHDVVRPVKPDTIAKSLAIGNPADGPYVLDVARRTGGAVEDVSEDEIRDGITLLARTEGIFAETAGGVTVATLKKLLDNGQLDPDAETVVFNTGDGLKTLDAISGRVGPTATIDADVTTPSSPPASPDPDPPETENCMTVSVRIPTILRTYTAGPVAGRRRRRHARRGHRLPGVQLPGHQGPRRRRAGQAAPLRQHLRRRGGRPLRERPRHPDPRGHADLHHPRRAGG